MTAENPVALITGAARRIGAHTAQVLHANGYNVIIHFRTSAEEAETLAAKLNQSRKGSAVALQSTLNRQEAIEQLAEKSRAHWGRVDALINNASSFYPTPIGEATEAQWEDLVSSNLKAPFFLVQALAEELRKNKGVVINIADIHADRPLKNHSIYCAAKAGNIMLTKSLARELAPDVRVNGIAPGAILWPEHDAEIDAETQQRILNRVPLGHPGKPENIADTILFFLTRAPYITGQILAVDGGRSVN